MKKKKILLILLIIIQWGTSLIRVYLTISPSRVSIFLFVGFKTSPWAMNKSYSLPLT